MVCRYPHCLNHTECMECSIMGHTIQYELPSIQPSSATTLVSVWHTRVFRTALTALMEPRTLWRRIGRFPSHRRQVALHTNLHYFAPDIRTIRTTRVLHSSQSCSFAVAVYTMPGNVYAFLRPIATLYLSAISDATLATYMFTVEILSHIAIQSSLRKHCLPLHLLCHYRILHFWNIQSDLHTL